MSSASGGTRRYFNPSLITTHGPHSFTHPSFIMAHVKAINVTSTSANMDKLSRSEFVGFVNDHLALDYTKVEQLCSGNVVISGSMG